MVDKKKKRLSPINLTSYPFARKETFFRIFGQEGEEEFLSSIEITGYHAIHPQKFQDSWFVKKFSSILKFIYIHFLYIYIDETLGRNYFKQIIVSSIERARYHHTLITILLFAKNWTIEMCGFRAHSTAIQWSHDRASGEKREREEGERERTVREVGLVTESALTRPRESSLCEPGKKWDCLNSPSTPRVGPPRSQEVWRTIAAINNGKSAPFVPWTANERERGVTDQGAKKVMRTLHLHPLLGI